MLQSDKLCSPTNSHLIRDRDRQSYGNMGKCSLSGMSRGNPKKGDEGGVAGIICLLGDTRA